MLAIHHVSRAARSLGLFCSPYSHSPQSPAKIRDLGSSTDWQRESEIRISKARLTEFGSPEPTFGIWYRLDPSGCYAWLGRLLYRHTRTMILYLITRNPLAHPHRLIPVYSRYCV
jgi:hypothetical protein